MGEEGGRRPKGRRQPWVAVALGTASLVARGGWSQLHGLYEEEKREEE